MGIKNERRKKHRASEVEPSRRTEWREGQFIPAENTRCQKRYQLVNSKDGSPSRMRKIHVTWENDQGVQKFYDCLQLASNSPSEWPDINVPDENHQESATDTVYWKFAEIDCAHGMCHIHPTGHNPPSGNPANAIELLQLNSISDVRRAQRLSGRLIRTIESKIVEKHNDGGGLNEQELERIVEESVRSAS